MPVERVSLHLGYSIPEGEAVAIPLKHTVVCGQTQEAGKTTALEGLITRSGLRAISFLTKRGEGAFSVARRIPPFFREHADWQYVASVLEATLQERIKFQRAWIMRLCEHNPGTKKVPGWSAPRTLRDVLANVEIALPHARGINEGVYTELRGYLRLVVPEIEKHTFATSVELQAGINVMDLSGFRQEMRALVIRSVLEWVQERESNVITIIPEAWEVIPQKRSSPAKDIATELIRKGAALGNYVFIDSQDIAGVDKELLRQMPVWLLGVQRERNEVKRTLEQIPTNVSKPSASDVMTQGLGQFYCCHGKHVIHTYAQPTWLSGEQAQAIAQGKRQVTDFARPMAVSSGNGELADPVVQKLDQILREVRSLGDRVTVLEQRPTVEFRPATPGDDLIETPHGARAINELRPGDSVYALDDQQRRIVSTIEETVRSTGTMDVETIYPQIRDRLLSDADFIGAVTSKVLAHVPSNGVVKVEAKEVVLKKFQQTEVGRILEKANALTPWQREVLKYVEAMDRLTPKVELLRKLKGREVNQVSNYKDLYRQADELAEIGFLTADSQGRLNSNLNSYVANKLKDFGASEAEVLAVVGQVLLKLE